MNGEITANIQLPDSIDRTLERMTMMLRKPLLATGLLAALVAAPCQAAAPVQAEAFDVLGSVMDKSQKQLDPKRILELNKEEAQQYREKAIAGWWEFMQANSQAKPGEFCAATFLRAKRESQPGGVDSFKEGMTVTLFGPGGDYRGALLAFTPLMDDHQFPKLQSGQKVLLTLKQGEEAPATLNAVFMTVGATARPMIAFAVPSIEALMAGMEDNWSFEVQYQGKSIADIAWHSGLAARDALQSCLKGAR